MSPNPIQEGIVEMIREKYGHLLLPFWNGLLGRDIFLLVRPKVLLPSANIKTLNLRHRLALTDQGAQISALNLTGVCSEIIALSDGLIEDIAFE